MIRPKLVLFTMLFVLNTAVKAQVVKEKIQKIGEIPNRVSDKYLDDTTSKPNYLIYPSIAYTPETGWEFGVINVVLFYAKNDKRNRLSEINSFTFITQEKQYGIWLDHAIYGNKDKYFFLGKSKFQYFPLKYFGIGNQASENNYEIINSSNFQLRERFLKQIKGNFYAGLEFDHQSLFNVSFDKPIATPINLPLGATGSSNTAIGVGLVYDKRHNVLNERKGIFAEIAYLNYGKYLGSDFAFNNIQFDGRVFRPGIGENQVWATQAIGQFNMGNIPFNHLALMGGESIMRGYYLGRFRDKNLMALQTEYRFLPLPFSKRWGFAAFAAIGSVEPRISRFSIADTKLTGGAGLRYLVFKSKDIFLRFDAAVTAEGFGYYLFIGEAF